MPMLTDLADVLRAAGLDVEEVPGWKSRGHTALGPMEKPTGILIHHTAGPKGGSSDYPSRNAILNGWPKLPGPLSQLGLARSGKAIVFAAGVCYHAGPTKDRRFRNVRCIGIEAEHPGDSTPWPPAQYAAYVKLVAALCKGYGLTVADVQGHKEQTAGKIDPTFSMDRFRADVAAALAAPATKPPAVTPPATTKPTTPTTGATTARTLALGDTGRDVKKFQSWLLAMFPAYAGPIKTSGGADGIFGRGTKQVVAEWQRRSGLTADGVFGPRSLAVAKRQGYKP